MNNDKSEDEDISTCDACGAEKDDDELWECNECEKCFCDNCSIYFESADVTLCKGCIDNKYPRKDKIVERKVYIQPEPIDVQPENTHPEEFTGELDEHEFD